MLSLNFTTCVINGCNQIRFTEITGSYSTTNTGGWGTPNATLAQATSAILTITDPNNVIYIVNLFDNALPSSNKDFYYDIPTTDITDTIIDGKWTFLYTVVANAVTYTKTKYSLFFCNSECCVSQMLADLDLEDCGCNCKDVNYDDYIKAWTFLQSLKNAAKCGSVDLFAKIKKIVDKLCKNKDCKTCR